MAIMNPYRSAYKTADVISANTVSLLAGKWVEFGSVTILAGTGVALGYGSKSGQHDAEGRALLTLKDGQATPALIPALVRIEIRDPQDRPIETVCEYRTEQLSLGESALGDRIPFPHQGAIIGEDWKYCFLAKADADATLTKANCSALMDVTTYTVR